MFGKICIMPYGVKAHYGGQKMLSQIISFLKIQVLLSSFIFLQANIKFFFDNYIQIKV
jgi:hypothetical protein